MKILKRLFCEHIYNLSHSAKATRSEGDDNLEVKWDFYECRLCNKGITIEAIINRDKNFYNKEYMK